MIHKTWVEVACRSGCMLARAPIVDVTLTKDSIVPMRTTARASQRPDFSSCSMPPWSVPALSAAVLVEVLGSLECSP